MAFFNDFKEKFMNTAQSVSNKTKDGLEITRISAEIRTLKDKENGLYAELGRRYYASAEKEVCDALCGQITELRNKISVMDQRRMQLRNQNRCPACGTVVNEGARFCPSCGRRMPEPETAAEPAPDAENTQFCPECGAMHQKGAAFCDICGHDFNGAAEPVKKEYPAPAAASELEAEEPAAEDTVGTDAQ